MTDLTSLFGAASVEPDRDGLFRWISREISSPLVAEIAAADYGHGMEENLEAFELLIGRGRVEAPIDTGGSWLQEVCELTKLDALSSELPVATHQQILFSTSVLVQASEPDGPWHDHVLSLGDPVAALVQSALALGAVPRQLALAMLADAVVNENRDPSDRVLLACGMFLLMTEQTPAAVDAVVDFENALFEQEDDDGWLPDRGSYDPMMLVWQRLFRKFEGRLDVGPIVEFIFS